MHTNLKREKTELDMSSTLIKKITIKNLENLAIREYLFPYRPVNKPFLISAAVDVLLTQANFF